MIALIVKDLLILRKMFYLMLLLTSFFFLLQNPPLVMITILTLVLITSAAVVEDRSNAHQLLNSLPLRRHTIISSKYVEVILFMVVVVVVVSILQVIFHSVFSIFEHPLPTFQDLWISFLIILFFASIFYPILFKFGASYTRLITLLFFVVIALFGRILLYLLDDHLQQIMRFVQQYSMNLWIFVLTVVVLIFFSLSWLLSIRIYEAKDF